MRISLAPSLTIVVDEVGTELGKWNPHVCHIVAGIVVRKLAKASAPFVFSLTLSQVFLNWVIAFRPRQGRNPGLQTIREASSMHWLQTRRFVNLLPCYVVLAPLNSEYFLALGFLLPWIQMKLSEQTRRRTKKLSFFPFVGIVDETSFKRTQLLPLNLRIT